MNHQIVAGAERYCALMCGWIECRDIEFAEGVNAESRDVNVIDAPL